MEEDIRRVEFVLDERELQFERSENKSLFEGLDVSPESIMQNPMNLMLSNFDNEYMKNERIGVVLFETLTSALRKYQRMVNENFWYQDMELVQVINDLITRYNTWITNQRGLILNTRDMVKEIKDMVDSEYITKISLDKFEQEMKLQLNEFQKNYAKDYSQAIVLNIDGKKIIELPRDSQLKEGDFIDYKKSK